MTGTLAQLVALVAYGNEFLTTGNLPEDFYPQNSVFQFCHSLQFIEVDGPGGKENLIGTTPLQWYIYLQQQGIQKLELHYQSSNNQEMPDHKLAGFIGGGGSWLIKLISDSPIYDYWYGNWAVSHKDDPDQKIWSIDYKHVHRGDLPVYTDESVERVMDLLASILIDISAFAIDIEYENFGNAFKNALAVLSSPEPEQGYYHQGLLPIDHYSLQARQLLTACSAAWVFGGMGSWNDIYVVSEEDNKRYDELSAALYRAINLGVLVATNSFQ